MQLQGVYTALVTPFSGGAVDFGKLGELVEMQVSAGVDGIIPVGTTGESPTLTYEEHQQVIETVVKTAAGRCQVIAGTGANSTSEAIAMTKHARAVGADATLQVTPYYNKPTQEGLYRHFSEVADQGGLPVVLYNVPGRTGVAIAIETVVRLCGNNNIVGMKEAGGSVERVSAVLDQCDITILSGDDALTLPMMAVGASGIVSVASNLIPAQMKQLTDAMLEGNWMAAQDLHRKYYPLFRDQFVETNPIPIKAAMAMAGLLEEEYRLPLCPLAPANREKLAASLKSCGIL
ncbi:4-hydroxy-tetrahydrodipicolinate synthase [Victivallis sp. Marseille-Q1083]|uniref:4-hydroxy-tetrahydrodipicolinate synthase n=1 Tax=Victivallis sp. Marseille-Q1083 TaxID=2717288 RepID=UPI00158F5925|nr:4-hydroxy-tetrahydrodipicolinate synthase [Victivallis sp. Marseille-Q1083]